jgi:hypothetical protein
MHCHFPPCPEGVKVNSVLVENSEVKVQVNVALFEGVIDVRGTQGVPDGRSKGSIVEDLMYPEPWFLEL